MKTVSLTLVVVFVSGIVAGCLGLQRFPRRTGDQAPSGKCHTFKWGGKSRLHWYVCCNNCNDINNTCDGKTYQSASKEQYCNSCGVDGTGNGTRRANYTCGGCTGQDKIQQKCTSRLRKIYQIPGFCWAFTFCFNRKCNKVGRDRRSTSAAEDSCFDLVCNDGETVESCPVDCCGTKNDVCDWRKYNGTNDCPPVCCSEPLCCDGTSGAERMRGGENVMLLVSAIGVLAWRLGQHITVKPVIAH